ncbi:MAG: hypothetical protein ACFFHV_00705 [Promethearchaeota archaeon]
MTVVNTDVKRKKSWKRNLIKVISIIVFIIFLYELYTVLMNLGASLLLALLIMLFPTLVFIGVLVRDKSKPFFSMFKKNKNNSKNTSKEDFLSVYEKYHPQQRRIDTINIQSKYRKPIIRKCSNCGIIVPGFAKKCPNCGENIGT